MDNSVADIKIKRIFVAFHCGSLKDCLETEEPISEDAFKKLLKSGLYKFYAYDYRIHADRYLLVDIVNNFGLPTWIHVYKL